MTITLTGFLEFPDWPSFLEWKEREENATNQCYTKPKGSYTDGNTLSDISMPLFNQWRACTARIRELGLSVRPCVRLLPCFLPPRATNRLKSNTNWFSATLASFSQNCCVLAWKPWVSPYRKSVCLSVVTTFSATETTKKRHQKAALHRLDYNFGDIRKGRVRSRVMAWKPS